MNENCRWLIRFFFSAEYSQKLYLKSAAYKPLLLHKINLWSLHVEQNKCEHGTIKSWRRFFPWPLTFAWHFERARWTQIFPQSCQTLTSGSRGTKLFPKNICKKTWCHRGWQVSNATSKLFISSHRRTATLQSLWSACSTILWSNTMGLWSPPTISKRTPRKSTLFSSGLNLKPCISLDISLVSAMKNAKIRPQHPRGQHPLHPTAGCVLFVMF